MKILSTLLLLAIPVLAHAADIHPGDSLANVQAALGTPTGQIQLGNKLVLVYDRGQVQLVDDKVTMSNLISPEALAVKQAQLKARANQTNEIVQFNAQIFAETQAAYKAQRDVQWYGSPVQAADDRASAQQAAQDAQTSQPAAQQIAEQQCEQQPQQQQALAEQQAQQQADEQRQDEQRERQDEDDNRNNSPQQTNTPVIPMPPPPQGTYSAPPPKGVFSAPRA